MFDDDAGWRLETFYAFPGCIGVGEIVVGEFLALQLAGRDQGARRGMQIAIQRCALMRIFAITQILHFHEAAIGLCGKFAARAVGLQRRQIIADGCIVIRDAIEGRHRQCKARAVRQCATGTPQFVEHGVVLCRVGDYADAAPVLGGRAHHGRAADVDVFDGVFQRAARLGNGRLERIEIDHQQVDGWNFRSGQRLHVGSYFAPRQQPAMDARMQRLDAAIEHFRETRVIGHFGDRESRIAQHFGGAAGGQQCNAETGQRSGEFENAGLVGDAD